MILRRTLLGLIGLFTLPAVAHAAGDAPLDLPVWSVAPFALLLLAIAVLPLAAGHWWHRNRNKALVAALFALPAAVEAAEPFTALVEVAELVQANALGIEREGRGLAQAVLR
jgi:hypothetical protein